MIYHWQSKLLSIRLEFFISPKLVPKMSSIFSRDKLMIPMVLSQSVWMFSVWLVFTSNLTSQTTWLKVKLKLVNLCPQNAAFLFNLQNNFETITQTTNALTRRSHASSQKRATAHTGSLYPRSSLGLTQLGVAHNCACTFRSVTVTERKVVTDVGWSGQGEGPSCCHQ